jgi:hypothetical protein
LGEGGDAAYTKIARKVNDAIEGHHKLTITSKELTRTIGTNLADAIANKMGTSLEDLEKKLKAGTVDATKFGNAMEEVFIAKGAKGLDAMWMRTGVITKKIHDAFGELFKNVDTGPLTDGLRNILSILDSTAPSAQAMASGITGAMNGIIKAIGDAVEAGIDLFLDLEIGALQTAIALKPLGDALGPFGDALGKLLGPLDDASGDTVSWASTLQEITGIAKGAADAINALTSAIEAYNKGTFTINAKQNLGMISADEATRQRAAVGDVNANASPIGYEEALNRKEALAKAAETGGDVGHGLANGMDGMTAIVHEAGKKLGEAATNGVKEGAGAHSPSLPAIAIGGYISQGLAMGMVDSPLPARAGRTIGGNALGGVAASALMAPAANDGGAVTYSISGLTIHITAPQGVTDAAGLSATGLVVALERLQLASGR